MGKIEELRERRAKIYLGGGAKAIEKQHARGKLSARERIDALLDPGTFVELGTFVKHRCHVLGMENKETPGEGVVAGHGLINGRTVYIYSQDFTILGGAVGEMHAAKIIAVQELAMKTGCPLIGLITPAADGCTKVSTPLPAMERFSPETPGRRETFLRSP